MIFYFCLIFESFIQRLISLRLLARLAVKIDLERQGREGQPSLKLLLTQREGGK